MEQHHFHTVPGHQPPNGQSKAQPVGVQLTGPRKRGLPGNE